MDGQGSRTAPVTAKMQKAFLPLCASVCPQVGGRLSPADAWPPCIGVRAPLDEIRDADPSIQGILNCSHGGLGHSRITCSGRWSERLSGIRKCPSCSSAADRVLMSIPAPRAESGGKDPSTIRTLRHLDPPFLAVLRDIAHISCDQRAWRASNTSPCLPR